MVSHNTWKRWITSVVLISLVLCIGSISEAAKVHKRGGARDTREPEYVPPDRATYRCLANLHTVPVWILAYVDYPNETIELVIHKRLENATPAEQIMLDKINWSPRGWRISGTYEEVAQGPGRDELVFLSETYGGIEGRFYQLPNGKLQFFFVSHDVVIPVCDRLEGHGFYNQP